MPEKKTTNSIHEEHRARMQERVARDGLTSLAAHEVLEYLLYFSIPRRDTNPLAHRLIQHFGGFCQVLDASEEELMQVQGIGPRQRKTAAFLPGCCPLLPDPKAQGTPCSAAQR